MTAAPSEIAVGSELTPTTKAISQDVINRYGKLNGDNNIIHYDGDFARQHGYRDAIAHGMMTFGLISEMMTRFLGKGWVSGGKIEIILVAPVYSGDTITARGKVKEKVSEGDALRLVVETWCENQDGERVLLGEASGLVS